MSLSCKIAGRRRLVGGTETRIVDRGQLVGQRGVFGGSGRCGKAGDGKGGRKGNRAPQAGNREERRQIGHKHPMFLPLVPGV